MGKKTIIGKCKLCGQERKLTFEHVPPEAAFNNKAVNMIYALQIMGDRDRYPWDTSGLRGNYQQRGKGGYYLCEECNSRTGSWYVSEYVKFICGIHSALTDFTESDFSAVTFIAKKVKVLNVIKAIMTMFCDINNECFGDEKLRGFLLDKQSTKFDKSRYRIYAYLHSGTVERMNGVTAILRGGAVILISEISAYPVGFALYINKPEQYSPLGTDITDFVDKQYDEECKIEMTLPVLQNNIMYPGDYRTKQEILDCIEKK